LASAGDHITLQLAQDILGTATSQAVIDVIDAVIKRHSSQGLEIIHRSLDSGSDPRQFARQIVEYLRGLLLVAMGNASQVDATPESRNQLAQHAQTFSVSELLEVIQAFNQAATETRSNWQPALPIEMAFIEAITLDKPPGGSGTATDSSHKPQAAQRVNSVEGKSTPPKSSSEVRETDAIETPSPDAAVNQRLTSRWDQIYQKVHEKNPRLAGIMNSAKTRVIKGSLLTLGYNGDFYMTTFEKPENLELLRNVLKQVMDMEIDVQAELVLGKKSTPPAEVDSDGLVASALRDLGGEIVDIQ